MEDKKSFSFEISLSVLNHLGRSLYRSFTTILGEAISNSWDADANNVHIYVQDDKNGFFVKDDGVGMTADEFQGKFLRIGYSKRKTGTKSAGGRPFIGRKGIGKLALLSCADRVTVISKVSGGDYVGGTIDNADLDQAITSDSKPDQYTLEPWKTATFAEYIAGHEHGTIIHFDGIKKGIRTSFDVLAKTIALYFRFSLLDSSFKIFVNGKKISHEDLTDLAQATEFLWEIGKYRDPYLRSLKAIFSKNPTEHERQRLKIKGVRGFVASVKKPTNLKIMGAEERIGIDLFVNGRLREQDILKHIPTARLVESYLYGQVHFDVLDDQTDRFTSSREGIVADDPKYGKFLAAFRKKILKIIEDWDKWRIKHRELGDADNPRLSRKDRASLNLYGEVSKEYGLPKTSTNRGKVGSWVDELAEDARFNFESYADCFISENLVRRYIKEEKIPLSREAKKAALYWRGKEKDNMGKGNISIAIRRNPGDSSYLSMDDLANLVDKRKDAIKEASLARDAHEYRPIRDAVAHTALLTDKAKNKLSTVKENIKGRVKNILSQAKPEEKKGA